ncbi:MAG: hypothetical protein R2939_12070 [Kofleriaceae bacterium]
MTTRALAGVALAVVLGLAGATAVADTFELTLPRGSKLIEGDRYASGRGFRDTYDHVARQLARRKVEHQAVAPVRIRGVELGRFLSRDPATPWQAIQVYRRDDRTVIAFIRRASAPAAAP